MIVKENDYDKINQQITMTSAVRARERIFMDCEKFCLVKRDPLDAHNEWENDKRKESCQPSVIG